ncbi:MAG: ATP-binding protein [Candidatus Thorarchaeota archaeon]
MDSEDKSALSAVEIKAIPRSYLAYISERNQNHRFENRTLPQIKLDRFLGALLQSDIEIGFRIQVINGRARLVFLTPHNAHTVTASFLPQFLDFSLSSEFSMVSPTPESPVFAAEIRGVPQYVPQSLDGLANALVRTGCSSIYQVWASPRKPSLIGRQIAKRRYGSVLGRSQRQDSAESSILGGRETRTRFDVDALSSTELHKASYERMNAEKVLECRVVIACWGFSASETVLNSVLNTFLGTLSSPDKRKRLGTKVHRGDSALAILKQAMQMDKRLKGALLSTKEAVPYFEIPHVELGIVQNSPATFTTAKTTRIDSVQNDSETLFQPGHIAVGRIYRQGTLDDQQVKYLDVEDLRLHTAIFGMTGSGKSSTKNRIVIDAWKNGISSLLIEPVKSDARALMAAIPELRIFTVGRELVAPFRLNPFLVEKGVPIQAHVDQLYHCFLAAWPLYGILANHLRKVIVRTYRRNGWDLLLDTHGDIVTLESFRQEAERYASSLKYGSELKQDFTGAILSRVEELCDPSRAAIFNAGTNLSIADLFAKPTIIEMKSIKDPEFKALLLNLILARVEQYFESLGVSDRLRGLLVIDEAHRFLRELPRTLDTSEIGSSKRQVQDQIEDMTSEARSVGLGVMFLDQSPSELARGVVKNCHTKIIHRLESHEDRRMIARETGCNREQEQHIEVLEDGEAVVRSPVDKSPLNLQIIYDPTWNPEMERNWTDDEIRDRMQEFYRTHPEFAKTPDIPELEPVQEIEDREAISLRVQIEDIVRSEGYRKNYRDCINDPMSEGLRAVEELVVYYGTHVASSSSQVGDAVRLLLETSIAVHGPPPYEPSWAVINELIEQSREIRQTQSRRSSGEL